MMINYELLYTGSDCTRLYRVTFRRPMTVGKFIEEVLTAYQDQWGFIDVIVEADKDVRHCKYMHGQIEFSDIEDDILAKDIKSIKGCGGWTRCDYNVYI